MNSFNKALQKLCNAIFKGFYLFAAFTFTVLLTILLINVISRNLLGGSIAWIEEISRYIFTWMMFMGIAIGVHYKKHLGVEFVVGLYPAKVKKAAYFISDVLTLVLFIILAIYGFRYAGKSMKMFSPSWASRTASCTCACPSARSSARSTALPASLKTTL